MGVPPGTGVIVAGGNHNVFRNNHLWNNRGAAFQLFGVPAFIRGEGDLAKQADTSNHNRFEANVLGVAPTGERRPNGRDVWWDGQGTGNCWQPGVALTTPAALPRCGARAPELSGGSDRLLAEPVKIAKLFLCSDFNAAQARLPARLRLVRRLRTRPGGDPARPGRLARPRAGRGPVLGTGAPRGQTAPRHPRGNGVPPGVGEAGERRLRLISAGSVVGLTGLALDVVAAAMDDPYLTGVALLLVAGWSICLGAALRPGGVRLVHDRARPADRGGRLRPDGRPHPPHPARTGLDPRLADGRLGPLGRGPPRPAPHPYGGEDPPGDREAVA
ncbi:hypothetical protein ACFSTC_36780 [Nonomuraea ferruginea]